MADKTFTEPENTTDEWTDVRMTDPDLGEWDIDCIVTDGRVGYVDIRVKPESLPAFIHCLVDDVSDEQARTILADVADRRGIDVPTRADDE